MEFTKQIALETEVKVQGNKVLLNFKNGPAEEMYIGEEVETATWTDNFHLLVTLTNGGVRLYRDIINFENI